MKEKSLTTSLQSLHKRQSEYYVKLEKCLSEEKKEFARNRHQFPS